MKFNLFTILFRVTMLTLIIYGVLNNIIFSLSAFLLVMIFFYISRINSMDRRENLNIIRDENKLYFYLTDDLLFSVELSHDQSLSDILQETIYRELPSLQDIIRKISFINFREDKLLAKLNSSFLKN